MSTDFSITGKDFKIKTITIVSIALTVRRDSKQRQLLNWGYDSKGCYFKCMIWNPESISPEETM